MNEWKLATMMSMIGNILMVTLLMIAFLFIKQIVTNKNMELEQLQNQLESLTATASEQVLIGENEPANQSFDMLTEVTPVQNSEQSAHLAPYASSLMNGYSQLSDLMNTLPSEEAFAQLDVDVATLAYEDIYLQANAYLANMVDILTQELTGRSHGKFLLDQQKWKQQVNTTKAHQLSVKDNQAKLMAVKVALESTMKRNEQLLHHYFIENY